MTTDSLRREARIEADARVPLIRISRDFAATPAQLIRAHTDPGIFTRWVGPAGMETRIVEWDARDGGCWHYVATRDGVDYAFRGCFQHLVRAMRAVPGSRFTFDWNPNIGLGTFPAEQAYPGDAYVDVVGVDIYDVSWTWYPVPVGTTTAQAREAAWNWLLRGDHGLTFWSAFARAHAKPLTIPEWGVTARPDGHGGGDDPAFVDHMVDFITDPANNVRGNHYFNIDTPALQHDLTRSGTKFPASGVRLRTRASIMAGTSAVTAPAVPTVTPSPSPTARVGSVPLTASPTASPAASPTSPPAVTGRPVPAKASASARHRTASQRPHKKHKMHRRHRPSAATNTHLSQSR